MPHPCSLDHGSICDYVWMQVGEGEGGWGTDLFSRGGNSALEMGTSNFPTSINFLFLSYLKEVPGLVEHFGML